MSIRLATALLASLMLALPAIAQAPKQQKGTKKPTPTSKPQQPTPATPAGETDKPKSREDRIREEIERMRRQIRDGSLVMSHVRVTVRLKNGNRIRGVVKDGRLVERLDGLRFVEAERGTNGAGIRVYYFDDSGSYIFLPFQSIRRYDVGERLSAEQLAKIEARAKAANEAAREAYKKVEEKRAEAAKDEAEAKTEAEKSEADKQREAEADARAKEEKRLLDLVKEFPLDDGWSKERRDAIERRKVTVGVFPTGQEKRFLEVFSDWQKGVTLAKERAAKTDSGKPAKPTPKPSKTPPGGD